jgi:hypothetical protein
MEHLYSGVIKSRHEFVFPILSFSTKLKEVPLLWGVSRPNADPQANIYCFFNDHHQSHCVCRHHLGELSPKLRDEGL